MYTALLWNINKLCRKLVTCNKFEIDDKSSVTRIQKNVSRPIRLLWFDSLIPYRTYLI
jgi:signal recognition particle receptor subunit beta